MAPSSTCVSWMLLLAFAAGWRGTNALDKANYPFDNVFTSVTISHIDSTGDLAIEVNVDPTVCAGVENYTIGLDSWHRLRCATAGRWCNGRWTEFYLLDTADFVSPSR